MDKEMLINTVEGQECRIAIVSAEGLEELYVERASAASQVGNVYKGRVTNVEAAIQAAFVDFGKMRNGFLHISDLHPTYFPKDRRAPEAVGKKRPHRARPPIQDCLRRGQEVVVQITKEGIGTKGPTLTTYLSIPGRLLVMMPGMTRLGVSRKVDDDSLRARARDVLSQLTLPPDLGFILRTAGLDAPKRELQRDLNYLTRLWTSIKQRIHACRPPADIYQESDLVIRTVRDVYNSEVKRIVCDSEAVARKVKDFLNVIVPRSKHVIELYTGKEGMFYEYGLEHEIEQMHSRVVHLASGGSLVIDQAEALVAIDVNSGRYRQHTDAETTATKTNLQAAGEVARQLRLRDLGGVVVIDFIDMIDERDRRNVERALRDAMKNDRAKAKVSRMSAFGIMELTRQRVRPSLKQSVFARCEHCDGTGFIKSTESVALQVMRNLQRACANDDVARVEVAVAPSVAHHLSNFQRHQIARLETQTGKSVLVRANAGMPAGAWQFTCTDRRGAAVAWEKPQPTAAKRRALATVNVESLPAPAHPSAPPEATSPALTPVPAGTETAKAPVAYEHALDILEAEEAEEAEEPEGAAPQRPPAAAAPPAAQAGQAAAPTAAPQPPPGAPAGEAPAAALQGAAPPAEGHRKVRRGRRGGRKHRRRSAATPGAARQAQPGQAQPPQQQHEAQQHPSQQPTGDKPPAAPPAAPPPPAKQQPARPAPAGAQGAGGQRQPPASQGEAGPAGAAQPAQPHKTHRGRRRRRKKPAQNAQPNQPQTPPAPPPDAPAQPS